MLIAAKDRPMDARPESAGAKTEPWRDGQKLRVLKRPRSAPITAPATVRVGLIMYLFTARLDERSVSCQLPASDMRRHWCKMPRSRTSLLIVVWPTGQGQCIFRFLIEGEVQSTPQRLVLSPGELGSIRRCQCTRPLVLQAGIRATLSPECVGPPGRPEFLNGLLFGLTTAHQNLGHTLSVESLMKKSSATTPAAGSAGPRRRGASEHACGRFNTLSRLVWQCHAMLLAVVRRRRSCRTPLRHRCTECE